MSAEANDTHLDVDQEWRDIRKHLADEDDQLVKGLSAEIDGLLILAGLFSAVVTAFVIESYQLLQPNPQDRVIALLTQIAQHADVSAPMTPSMPAAEAFHPPRSAIRFNSTWFLSLALALVVALFGLVVKQWLLEYTRYRSNANMSAREQVRLRQHRFDRLEVWRVPQITMALSLLLQIAVIVFLIGFLDFLWQLNTEVALPSIVVVSFLFMLFVVSIMLAWFSRDCPYRSPLASLILQVLGWIFPLKSSWMDRDCDTLKKKGIPAPTRLNPDPELGYRNSLHDWKTPYTISLDLAALNRTVTSVTDYTRTKVALTCAVDKGAKALIEAIARELRCGSWEFLDMDCWHRNAPILQIGVLKSTMVAVLEAFTEFLLGIQEPSLRVGEHKLTIQDNSDYYSNLQKSHLVLCFEAVLALASVHSRLGPDQWLRISHNMESVAEARTKKENVKYVDSAFIHCYIVWVGFCGKQLPALQKGDHPADAEVFAGFATVESLEHALSGVISLLAQFKTAEKHHLDVCVSGMTDLLKNTILPYFANCAPQKRLKNSHKLCLHIVDFADRNFPSIDPELISDVLLAAQRNGHNEDLVRFLSAAPLTWAHICGQKLGLIREPEEQANYLKMHGWMLLNTERAFKKAVDAAFHQVASFDMIASIIDSISAVLEARMEFATSRGVSASDIHMEDQGITYQELETKIKLLRDASHQHPWKKVETTWLGGALVQFICGIEAAEEQQRNKKTPSITDEAMLHPKGNQQAAGEEDSLLSGQAQNTDDPPNLNAADIAAQRQQDVDPRKESADIPYGIPQGPGQGGDSQTFQLQTAALEEDDPPNNGAESSASLHVSLNMGST